MESGAISNRHDDGQLATGRNIERCRRKLKGQTMSLIVKDITFEEAVKIIHCLDDIEYENLDIFVWNNGKIKQVVK